MATLAPGILLKLLDGMTAGAAKPVGEHRNALLQVTDIVPADLDEKDLWPKHGFYIKVSDSSHSVYASLPFDQDELVLSNKMQLGQFIQVDRLEPGSPVPIIRGAKPIPGRHPLMGTPEPIVRSRTKANVVVGIKGGGARRGSWGQEQNQKQILSVSSPCAAKGLGLELEEGRSPMKPSCSPLIRRLRSSPESKDAEGGRGSLVRKSCISYSKFPRSRSVSRIPMSPFSAEKKPSTPQRTRATSTTVTNVKEKPPNSLFAAYQSFSESANNGNDPQRITLSGKLCTLGKEVMQQREEAQKVALQALRNASATETLARILKTFSDLSTTSKPVTPTNSFEQFLTFHQEISQAISDMEKIQSATSIPLTKSEEEQEHPSILHEITHFSNNSNNSTRRRALLSKSVVFTPDSKNQTKQNPSGKCSEEHNSVLAKSIKMAKQIQSEAGIWFMEFIEKALESGLKKQRCPQSVMLKVINWVEVEQCDGSKSNVHPRAGNVARKLRIKMKNP